MFEELLVNAFLFGLTGTPINKRDRNTFWAFGADEDEQGYMSRYSFQDSIRDKATLPLHFEAVDVKLHINKDAIDEVYSQMTDQLSEEDRDDLVKRAAKMAVLIKAPARVNAICQHIVGRIQNYVVNSGTGQVIYTPHTAVEVPVMMSELVKWLNADLDIHPLLVSGIAQFQLVHIHPFLDGNGRASRLLSTLCLYKAGYDFKRLFTISEYYDRDRPTFYRSIQSVRDNGMDMTGWLDCFVTGLETQMIEVRERSEQVIRRDVLVNQYGLNQRQGKALGYLLQHGKLTIQDFETLCPTVNRRSLQRDLKGMLDKNLITAEGATNQLIYRLAG